MVQQNPGYTPLLGAVPPENLAPAAVAAHSHRAAVGALEWHVTC